MLRTIEGIYRQGRIELDEEATDIAEATPVIVTFLPPRQTDLRERGIGHDQAEDLRGRLRTFAEEWERPEMDLYDAYEDAVET